MNWLAHCLLSEPAPEFRVGNLLPDLTSREELAALPPMFGPGIECHRRIDRFTDCHPVVRQTLARLSPANRRFGGIAVDLFYDHFLSTHWREFSPMPLDAFVNETYAMFDACAPHLPAETFVILQRMQSENWLGSYGTTDGVRCALRRLGARLRRPTDLSVCVADLEMHYDAMREDFRAFFPELLNAVESNRPGLGSHNNQADGQVSLASPVPPHRP